MYLAETLSLIHAGAVDEQRVEENCVAFLHLQVDSGVLWVIVSHTVVHLVNPTLKETHDAWAVLVFSRIMSPVGFHHVFVCTSHSG